MMALSLMSLPAARSSKDAKYADLGSRTLGAIDVAPIASLVAAVREPMAHNFRGTRHQTNLRPT
jgi:hypothetical protein